MLFNRLPIISRPLADWSRTDCQLCREQYMPSALKTSAINRQPVNNQLANKCRIEISREFGGFGRQWLPVVVRDRRFFLGCRRSATGLYLCVTGHTEVKAGRRPPQPGKRQLIRHLFADWLSTGCRLIADVLRALGNILRT